LKIFPSEDYMSRKYGVVVLLVLSSFTLILAGCGGSNQLAPPPVGSFSNSNFSGTYAFIVSGTNTGGFFTIAGSLQADGNGHITAGTLDINSPGTVGVLTNLAVSGTFIVHADGRGTATLNPTGSNTFTLDFILLNTQHAFVVRFDTVATGSGSMDLQNSAAFNLASLAGNLAFNVSGVDSVQNPESTAGVFTVTSAGSITAGVQDTADNGVIANGGGTGDPVVSGSMSSPAGGNGRGTLTISSGATSTRNFAYYVISSSQIRMIETDSSPVLSGDAFNQTSTSITGNFAFTASGASGTVPFAVGGILDTNAGNLVSGSVEDANAGGTITTGLALTGAFSSVANGRSTLSMNSATINYAVYPSSGGLQMLRIDPGFTASGTAFQQTGPFSTAAINGRFGGSFTGVDLNFGIEFDALMQITADGNGRITGAMDLNNSGTVTTGLALTGSYSFDSSGRSSAAAGALNNPARNQAVVFYAVSSSRILFVEIDSSVAVGALAQQQ
jgi:hypothetical protein